MKVKIFILAIFLLLPFVSPVKVGAENLYVSAKSAILLEADTERIIYEKDAYAKMPMASTTKIMTAAAVLSMETDLEREILVNSNDVTVEGSSMGLKGGETVRVIDLLYGLMLSSGNDAANVLAANYGGEIFIDIMNIIANNTLGLQSTEFKNPHGLPDDAHYSTAFDMAKIMKYALTFPEFRTISGTLYHNFSDGERTFYLSNHNRLLKSYKYCTGGKTGYTRSAGRCLVSVAEKDGITLICVTLNASDDWNDHIRLFDYGFQRLESAEVFSEEPVSFMQKVVGGEKDSVLLVSEEHSIISIRDNELTKSVNLPEFLYAPVSEGQQVGSVDYMCGKTVVYSIPLYAYEGVQKLSPIKIFWEYFKNLMLWT